MNCPECEELIPERSRFCAFCGIPLRACPSCGLIYRADAEFCGSCGTTLTEERKRRQEITDQMGRASRGARSEDDEWLRGAHAGYYGFLYEPRFPENRLYLPEGDVTIGAGDKNDLVIDRPAVSWNHALLVSRHGRLLIQDSASTNGTFVNDVRVTRSRELTHGDLIRFANVEYRLWVKPQIRDRS